MAACGINEHKEGCRKQRVLDRAANARKAMMEGSAGRDNLAPMPVPREDPDAPGYMRKMGSPPGITGFELTGSYNKGNGPAAQGDGFDSHNSTAIDRLRRERVRAQQLVEYSAKIPNRLSSVNYQQQW
ncbi:uncharacterized protein LOC143293765 [Babylonia areolata]|uniref:uncharacterized protein LOC143293765 n=1 Tax=Babylonia areolata TaxID=304850 RepID=UPI003FD2CA5E